MLSCGTDVLLLITTVVASCVGVGSGEVVGVVVDVDRSGAGEVMVTGLGELLGIDVAGSCGGVTEGGAIVIGSVTGGAVTVFITGSDGGGGVVVKGAEAPIGSIVGGVILVIGSIVGGDIGIGVEVAIGLVIEGEFIGSDRDGFIGVGAEEVIGSEREGGVVEAIGSGTGGVMGLGEAIMEGEVAIGSVGAGIGVLIGSGMEGVGEEAIGSGEGVMEGIMGAGAGSDGAAGLKFMTFSYASCNFGSSGAPVGPLGGGPLGAVGFWAFGSIYLSSMK